MDKIFKKDNKIIQELKVKEIRRLICNTDKGPLELAIRKGETHYFLTLDAVPLEKEQNDVLMEMLYPVQVEVPQVNNKGTRLLKDLSADKIMKMPNDIVISKKPLSAGVKRLK